MSKAFRQTIVNVGNELQWKTMPSQDFLNQFVNVASAMSELDLRRVIGKLDDQTFGLWTKKLWTEQDIQPDPNDYDAAFHESKPILRVLKRSLLYRLASRVECSHETRMNLQQQLALASLILEGPDALSNVPGVVK